MSRKILKAAIKIDGKIYTADHHIQAIDKARKAGKRVPPKGSKEEDAYREKNGVFLLSDGKLITRDQAEKEFDIRHSEELPKLNNEGEKKKGRKFVIVTTNWCALLFCQDKRNKDNGDEIIVATNPKPFKDEDARKKFESIGKGIVPSFALQDIMDRRERFREYEFVFDGNHSVKENTILRKEKFKVCNQDAMTFEMENDREKGILLAEETFKIESPLWEEYKTGKEGIELLKEYPDNGFFMKPNAEDESHLTTPPVGKDGRKANEYLQMWLESIEFKKGFVLQKEIKGGTEVNLEYFCVNGEPISAQINFEVKRISEASLIDGYEKGALCGCAYDVCRNIQLDHPLVLETLSRMKPFLREKHYTGFADLNIIIGENNIWFIEFCFRTGYNAHVNYFMNVSNKDYLNTMADMREGKYKPDVKKGWGASVTLYCDHPAKDIPVMIDDSVIEKVALFDGMKKGKTVVQTGDSNEIAIIGGYGNTIERAIMDAYDNVSKVLCAKSDYRSDGLKDNFNSSPIMRLKAIENLYGGVR